MGSIAGRESRVDEHGLSAVTRQRDRVALLLLDSEGRIVLPEVLARHAGITNLAAFVGRGSIFEIWEPKSFEAYKAEARRRAVEQGRTLRQGRETER